jgi:hypothetical protein
VCGIREAARTNLADNGGHVITLGQYTQVLGRHRKLVTIGAFLSLALALLSYVKVSPHGITYRASETWSSATTVFFTQPGAPEWRAILEGPESKVPPDRLATLVPLYAALASSNAITDQLEHRGLLDPQGISSTLVAAAVPSVFGQPTQLMTITTTGLTPAAAQRLGSAATGAFMSYLTARQQKAGIPDEQRVQVRVVEGPGRPLITKPRRKTGLIVILLAGIVVTIAAAFVRDNMRRTKPQSTEIRDVSAVRLAPAENEQAGRHERPAPADSSTSNGHKREVEVAAEKVAAWAGSVRRPQP